MSIFADCQLVPFLSLATAVKVPATNQDSFNLRGLDAANP